MWGRCLEPPSRQWVSSHRGAGRSLVTIFKHSALSSSHFAALHSLFLPLLWKACLFHSASFSSVFPFPLCSPPPPLTQALRSPRSKLGWVQSSKISAERLIYSHHTGLFIPHFLRSGGLLHVWAFPLFPVSYPEIQSAHWCHKEVKGATKGLISSNTTQGSVLRTVYGRRGCAIHLDKAPFGRNQGLCNEWPCLFASAIFLCLIMHTVISAPDKWLISSWSGPAPSDACLLSIVAVVMNHWPVIFDQEGKVINQLHLK